MSELDGEGCRPQDSFATTQWSVVLAAGRRQENSDSRTALAALCQNYWQPVYRYVRRRAPGVEAAQDLTQEFFLGLLQRNSLQTAAPERGRFRAFLLTCVKNYLANERERAHAHKRGGALVLSFDWQAAESGVHWEPVDALTPERRFEQEWATTLLERTVARLRDEFAAAGKLRQFDVLRESLTSDRERLPFADLAAKLDCSAEAARQAAHRLRKQYRELLRAEIAQTVADPRDVDDELHDLFAAFGE